MSIPVSGHVTLSWRMEEWRGISSAEIFGLSNIADSVLTTAWFLGLDYTCLLVEHHRFLWPLLTSVFYEERLRNKKKLKRFVNLLQTCKLWHNTIEHGTFVVNSLEGWENFLVFFLQTSIFFDFDNESKTLKHVAINFIR